MPRVARRDFARYAKRPAIFVLQALSALRGSRRRRSRRYVRRVLM